MRWMGAFCLAVLAACGDDAGGGDGGSGDAGPGTDGGGGDAGCRSLACTDRTPNPACGGTWVVGVSGRIVDEAGGPVAGARPQLCLRTHPDDMLTCLAPPMTDADGRYEIIVPTDPPPFGLRCLAAAVMRVLRPGVPLSTSYCRPPLTPVDSVIEPGPIVLFAVMPAAALPPEGDPTTEREVVLADGLAIDVTPDRIGLGGDYIELAARRVPLDADPRPCFLSEEADVDGLYALAPEFPVDGQGFAVRIPNGDGLAPGTRVELLLQGGLDTVLGDGTEVEEADVVVFGNATVSGDGSIIEGDAVSGLPYFSWLAYRAAR